MGLVEFIKYQYIYIMYLKIIIIMLLCIFWYIGMEESDTYMDV